MANVRFFTCTYSQISGFTNKAAGDLFFASDTNTIYRYNGSSMETYGGSAEVTIRTETGDPSNPTVGVLYVNTVDGTVKVKPSAGSNLIQVANYVATTTTVGPASGTGAATNNDVPTSLAVRTAIETAVSGLTVAITGNTTSSSYSGKAPQLDSNGMLPSAVLPALAISEFKGAYSSMSVATSTSALVSGSNKAELGDYIIIRHSEDSTDTHNSDASEDGTWILSGSTPSSSDSWTQIYVPEATTYTEGTGIDISNTGVVSLDPATASTLGGIKVGTNLSITGEGVLSSTNTWRPVKVGSNTLNDTTSTIEFAAGGDASVAYDSTNKKITFSATNTTYSPGSGISIDPNNSNAIAVKLASGTNSISVNGSGELVGTDTNTWRPFKVGGTTVNDKATTLELVGDGATSVSYASSKVTISSTNTTYSAGTAIAIDTSSSNAIGVKLANGSALTTDTSGNLEIQWQTIS